MHEKPSSPAGKLSAWLFRTKPIEAILQDPEAAGHQLRRSLGPVQLTLFGIGGIIGAGIFATIGTAAAGDAQRPGAGPALMLSFVITAIVCAFTALCYAEFASRIPISGSAYTYAYATLGEIMAWIIGWDLIIEYAVGNIAVAVSWANYFKTLLKGIHIPWLHIEGIVVPDWLSMDYRTALKEALNKPEILETAPHLFGHPIVFNLLAVSIVALITAVLVIGVRESAWFNAVMVAIKIVVLSFFIVVGFMWVEPENWSPFMPNGWSGVSAGAAVVFFAYIGFDAVSTVAEETRHPQRNLPIAIIASLIICTIFYIVVSAVFTGLISFSDLRSKLASEQAEPLTMALEHALPKARQGWVVPMVACGSVIAHTAVLLVFQLGQARIFFSMARDGLLPPVFYRVHPRFRTPHVGTILTGIFVAAFAAFASIDEMVDLTNIGTLFAFILVCAGVIVLRFKGSAQAGAFRVPGGSVIPVLGVVSCLYLIYYLPPTSWLRFAAWLNLGFVIYVGYGAVHSRLTGRALSSPPAEHDARTARVGMWLALLGTGLLVVMHGLDEWQKAMAFRENVLRSAFQITGAMASMNQGPSQVLPVLDDDVSRQVASATMGKTDVIKKSLADVFKPLPWLEMQGGIVTELFWFLLIPLGFNALVLCPLVIRRAVRAWRQGSAGKPLHSAGVAAGLAIAVVVYLCFVARFNC
jgi:APA family basic amino acid/polyamine antiporter